ETPNLRDGLQTRGDLTLGDFVRTRQADELDQSVPVGGHGHSLLSNLVCPAAEVTAGAAYGTERAPYRASFLRLRAASSSTVSFAGGGRETTLEPRISSTITSLFSRGRSPTALSRLDASTAVSGRLRASSSAMRARNAAASARSA